MQVPPNHTMACPHCQVHLGVHPTQAGTVISCPQCQGQFQIPVPMAQAGYGPQGDSWSSAEVQMFASKKVAAGVCGILLGGLGVHKFILGFNTAGVIMLLITLGGVITGACLIFPLFASAAMNVIGLVEGIIYLTKTDEDFYQTYAVQRREWF